MAAERTAALERLWDEILDGVDAELGDRLNGLLEVEAGSRFSVLERLRTAPAITCSPSAEAGRKTATRIG